VKQTAPLGIDWRSVQAFRDRYALPRALIDMLVISAASSAGVILLPVWPHTTLYRLFQILDPWKVLMQFLCFSKYHSTR